MKQPNDRPSHSPYHCVRKKTELYKLISVLRLSLGRTGVPIRLCDLFHKSLEKKACVLNFIRAVVRALLRGHTIFSQSVDVNDIVMKWGIRKGRFFLHYVACWGPLFRSNNSKPQRNCVLEAASWAWCLSEVTLWLCLVLLLRADEMEVAVCCPPWLAELFLGTLRLCWSMACSSVMTVTWSLPFPKLHGANLRVREMQWFKC